ncbi:Stealth protein CR2, conserved region 2, partial [Rhizoctonia solani]
MPSTRAYSLLPTSGSTETLPSPGHDDAEFEEAWPSERAATHGWFPLAATLATRRSRTQRPYTVTIAALSTMFILVIISTLYDNGLVTELSASNPIPSSNPNPSPSLSSSPAEPEPTSTREPTVRDCFELPSDELIWQTTQLPPERSELCPFDPESFAVLRESPHSSKSKSKPNSIRWSNECLEDMLADGQAQPSSCDQHSGAQKIDLVWTWVNGSSALLELTRRDRNAQVFGAPQAESESEPESETNAGLAAKLFRDHDELRHSIRAALRHFDTESNSKADFFLLGSDMPVSVHGSGMDDDPITSEARVGQLPSWLDFEDMSPKGEFTHWSRDGKQTRLQVRHHRDIFSHYEGTVFNSLAIESQFSNLDKIGVSDVFVYVNDDVFFSRDLSPRDFHMQEQGIVMRMQNYISISPDPSVPQHDGLEWESLQYSNHLLSTRFGSRHRPYPAHLAKTLSISMLKEVSRAWPKDLNRVVRRPFRGMKHMTKNENESEPADMYMVFMEHHWIVERWREALLWSWVVARGEIRSRKDANAWTQGVAQQAWSELGGKMGEYTLAVTRAPRSTLENADEWAGAKATSVSFSSLDGYPYSEEMAEQGWVSEGDVCELSFDHCLALHDTASRTFQRIAFEEPIKCGDCIIRALVNQSGKRGLEAFLPPKSKKPFSKEAKPALPLGSSWQDTDFRLATLVPEWVNTRQFVLRMLQRYRFVLGDTPFMFAIVTDPERATQYVEAITSKPELAILCVNDDVAERDDSVRGILGDWMGSRWNQSATWERRQ